MDVCSRVLPHGPSGHMRASLALLRLLKARRVLVYPTTQIKLKRNLGCVLRLFANRTLFLSIRHRTFALQAISTNVSSGSSMNVARLWITLCKTWKSCECKRKFSTKSSLVICAGRSELSWGTHNAPERGHTTSLLALRSKLGERKCKEQLWRVTISGLVLH